MSTTKRWLTAAALIFAALGNSSRAAAEQVHMLGVEFAAFGRFYSVNVANGSLTTLGNASGFYAAMDFSPDGVLYAASTFLHQVNPATGQELSRRSISFQGGPGGDILTGLTFSTTGDLYGIGNGNGNLWRLDPLTAVAQFVGSSGRGLFALEFGPDGRLFGAGFDLWEINPLTGGATQIGTIGNNALLTALDFAADGVLYGADSNITTDSLYAINIQTGQGTLIGRTGGHLVALASENVIPEPSALVLAGTAALCLLGYRGRRRATV